MTVMFILSGININTCTNTWTFMEDDSRHSAQLRTLLSILISQFYANMTQIMQINTIS